MSLKGDIGVFLVAYELMRRGWNVFINQGKIVSKKSFRESQGYDILAEKRHKEKRIEVKFIDSFFRGKKYKKNLTTRVTPKEFNESDYVIIVVLHENDYSIYTIPKKSVKKVSHSGDRGITIPIYYSKGKESKSKIEKFKVKPNDNWDILLGIK